MLDAFKRAAGGARLSYEIAQATGLGRALARLGVVKQRPRTGTDGRENLYLLPSLVDMRAAFEKDLGRAVAWPEVAEVEDPGIPVQVYPEIAAAARVM